VWIVAVDGNNDVTFGVKDNITIFFDQDTNVPSGTVWNPSQSASVFSSAQLTGALFIGTFGFVHVFWGLFLISSACVLVYRHVAEQFYLLYHHHEQLIREQCVDSLSGHLFGPVQRKPSECSLNLWTHQLEHYFKLRSRFICHTRS
jgi:hypothetical protein